MSLLLFLAACAHLFPEQAEDPCEGRAYAVPLTTSGLTELRAADPQVELAPQGNFAIVKPDSAALRAAVKRGLVRLEYGAAVRAAEVIERSRPANLGAGWDWSLGRLDQLPGSAAGKRVYRMRADAGAGVHVWVVDSGVTPVDGMRTHEEDSFSLVGGGPFSDEAGHGTAVATIIGGETAGLAPWVTIHSAKVLNRYQTGCTVDVTDALLRIARAATRDALTVVNISAVADRRDDKLDETVESLVKGGILVVTAAGNRDSALSGISPAGAPTALTVGSTDYDDDPSGSFGHGPELEFVAPGFAVATMTPGGRPRSASGTSIAAPQVTGAIALLLQHCGQTGFDDVLGYVRGCWPKKQVDSQDVYFPFTDPELQCSCPGSAGTPAGPAFKQGE